MSDSVSSTVDELLDRASDLPYGPGRVALVEETVRYADLHGDVASGYRARMELLDAAVMAGRGDLLVAHYPWCLAQFDRNPDPFDEFQLLWRFKWVMWRTISFPEISLEQIHKLLDEMAERYLRYGAGERVIAKFRLSLALHRGHSAEARNHYRDAVQLPRDELSNCPACEADSAADLYGSLGDHPQAVREARDILHGRLSCRLVPESTHATLLHSLFELQDDAQAIVSHRSGIRLSNRSADLGNLAKHITFLARSGNRAPAIRIVERNMAKAAAGYEPRAQFEFLLACRFLCDRLLATGETKKLRVPPPLPKDVPSLRAWLDGECSRLAALFDRRNGTDHYARQIADQAELHRNLREIPLRG